MDEAQQKNQNRKNKSGNVNSAFHRKSGQISNVHPPTAVVIIFDGDRIIIADQKQNSANKPKHTHQAPQKPIDKINRRHQEKKNHVTGDNEETDESANESERGPGGDRRQMRGTAENVHNISAVHTIPIRIPIVELPAFTEAILVAIRFRSSSRRFDANFAVNPDQNDNDYGQEKLNKKKQNFSKFVSKIFGPKFSKVLKISFELFSKVLTIGLKLRLRAHD